MNKLTDEQKKEIIDGVETEGFGYYFSYYTNKWAEYPSEIRALALAVQDLEAIIETWKEDLQYGEAYHCEEEQ